MTPFAKTLIPHSDIELFDLIKGIVTALDDDVLGQENNSPIAIDCHTLVRAIARLFNVRVVDGYLVTALEYEHSWLVTPHGNVIDVYPVGVASGPMLIHASGQDGLSSLYRRSQLPHDFNSTDFLNKVEKIEIEILRLDRQR